MLTRTKILISYISNYQLIIMFLMKMQNVPFDLCFVWISTSRLEVLGPHFLKMHCLFFEGSVSNPQPNLPLLPSPRLLLQPSFAGVWIVQPPPSWALSLWQLHPSLFIGLSIQSCECPDPKTCGASHCLLTEIERHISVFSAFCTRQSS